MSSITMSFASDMENRILVSTMVKNIVSKLVEKEKELEAFMAAERLAALQFAREQAMLYYVYNPVPLVDKWEKKWKPTHYGYAAADVKTAKQQSHDARRAAWVSLQHELARIKYSSIAPPKPKTSKFESALAGAGFRPSFSFPEKKVNVKKNDTVYHVIVDEAQDVYGEFGFMYRVESWRWKSVCVRGKFVSRLPDENKKEEFEAQSGIQFGAASRAERRYERERAQRVCAATRLRNDMMHKMSKSEREAYIKAQRDKRTSPDLDDFEPQGLKGLAKPLTVAVTAVTSLVLLKKTANNTITEVTQRVKAELLKIRKRIKDIFWVPMVLALVWFLVPKLRGAAVIAGLSCLFAQLVPKPFREVVAGIFSRDAKREEINSEDSEEYEQQSGFGIGGIVASAFCLHAFRGRKLGTNVMHAFSKQVTVFDRTRTGVDSFVSWILKTLQDLVNFGLSFFCNKRINFLSPENKELSDWIRRVQNAHAEVSMGDVPTPERISRLMALAQEGKQYRDICYGTDLQAPVERAYKEVMAIILPYLSSVSSAAGMRVEPVSIIFGGGAGIGKSAMSRQFNATLLLKSGLMPPDSTPDELNKQMFQKGSSKYWNGYVGQKVLVMDDIFQSRVATGTPENDYMNFIKIMSSWAFPLDMADVNSKGRFFCCSRIIFGTTNAVSFASEASHVIIEPEALRRRVRFGYWLAVKPDFARNDGKLDVSKITQLCNECNSCGSSEFTDYYPWHVWTATPWDFLEGRAIGPAEEMVDVIDKIVADLQHQEQSYHNMEAGLVGLCSAHKFKPQSSVEDDAIDFDAIVYQISEDMHSIVYSFDSWLNAIRDGVKDIDDKRQNTLALIEDLDTKREIWAYERDPDYHQFQQQLTEAVNYCRRIKYYLLSNQCFKAEKEIDAFARFINDEYDAQSGVDKFQEHIENMSNLVMEGLTLIEKVENQAFKDQYREDSSHLGTLAEMEFWVNEYHQTWVGLKEPRGDYACAYHALSFVWSVLKDRIEAAGLFTLCGSRCKKRLSESMKIFKVAMATFVDCTDIISPSKFVVHLGDQLFEAGHLILKDVYWKPIAVEVLQENVVTVLTRLRKVSMINTLASTVGFIFIGTIFTKLLASTIKFLASMLGIRFGGYKTQSNVPEPKAPAKARPIPIKYQEQGVGTPVDVAVRNNVYNNTYKLYYQRADGVRHILGQVIMLDGKMGIMPKHFRHQMLDNTLFADEPGELKMRSCQNGDEHSFSVKTFLSFPYWEEPDTDAVFLELPIRAHRNIVKSLIEEKDIEYIKGTPAQLMIATIEPKLEQAPSRSTTYCNTASVGIRTNVNVGKVPVKRVWAYTAQTNAGDCGAPLINLRATSFAGREFMGFHVAAQTATSSGISVILTKEMVTTARAKIGTIVSDNSEDDANTFFAQLGISYDGTAVGVFDKGSFQTIGVLDKTATICRKTAFEKTHLYGQWGEDLNSPAHLKPVLKDGVLVDPMDLAREPYSSSVLHFDYPWLHTCAHVALTPFNKATKDFSRKILGFREAVEGIPHWKFRSIPRGTGAGFPFNMVVKSGKKEIFGKDGEFDFTSPMAQVVENRVAHILSEAKEGRRCMHVFQDFLKDELRPPKKIDAVATRLISSAPIDYTVAFRQYFGAFSAAVMMHNVDSGMAPGVCAYSDWDRVLSHISKKGSHVFDGDFKGYDTSQMPCVMELVLDQVNAWYRLGPEWKPEDDLVRQVLFEDLLHSRHIGGVFDSKTYKFNDIRYIYQWAKSLPSGHPFTTIMNSIYTLILLVAAYYKLTGRIVDFWDHVSPLTYGDDNLANPDESVSDVYHQENVSIALKELFNVTYTPGAKDGLWRKRMTVDEVTFLKRRFTIEDGQVLAPLELTSFLYTPYWIKNRKLEKKIIEDNLEMTLNELSLHDQNTWDRYAPCIVKAMHDHGTWPRYPPKHKEYRAITMAQTDNWY